MVNIFGMIRERKEKVREQKDKALAMKVALAKKDIKRQSMIKQSNKTIQEAKELRKENSSLNKFVKSVGKIGGKVQQVQNQSKKQNVNIFTQGSEENVFTKRGKNPFYK